LTDPASTPEGAATAFDVAAAPVVDGAVVEFCANATAERTEKRRVILSMVERTNESGLATIGRQRLGPMGGPCCCEMMRVGRRVVKGRGWQVICTAG